MKSLYKYFLFMVLMYFQVLAGNNHAVIDTVLYFKPGTGQNVGQDSAYYPANIFKLPPSTASKNIPASSPDDVCSLGLGGEIVVGFKDGFVVDGPGADFTVFENPFLNPVTGKIFAEPGKIAVSLDGVHFKEFPFDSLTLSGCAGVTPTNGDKDPFNPAESGGDSFDIGKLGFSKIKYIKITDLCQMILNNPKHPYYDPIITGFDLDCVVAVNYSKNLMSGIIENSLQNFDIIQKNNIIRFSNGNLKSEFKATLYNYAGNKISESICNSELILPNCLHGIYFLSIEYGNKRIIKKLFLN